MDGERLGSKFGPMQTRLKPARPLDERNARHVSAALTWLQEGNVGEACKEIRMVQRMFADHPSVIELRRRLVAAVCGWEEEALSEQAAPALVETTQS